jgi:opacity protein-like surface antigen
MAMKRYACLLTVVAAIVAGTWVPAAAQTAGEEWDVVIAPYILGASMSGSTTVRGREVDVDVSMSDIFSNLQFGAMGLVVAKKGNWGFGADAIWMALGRTVRNTNVDFNQGAFAFYGLRQLGPAADLTFGLRVNTLQGELKFKTFGVDVSQDKTWVDPIVGLRLRTPAGHPVKVGVYGEIGGFGAGSDFAWQIFPTFGINFTDNVSLELGYRWLDLDYSTGEGNEQFKYDVLTQGPVAGVAFRF